MFTHNFKYTLKILFKNKMLIFWTFAFPIILGTFFQMAFSDIEKNEKLDIIDIAIVDNKEFQENTIYKESFKVLSDKENEDRLFHTKYVTEEKAKSLLSDDEITGYLIIKDNKPKVVVGTSDINETILKFVVEEITSKAEIMKSVANLKIEELKKNTPPEDTGNYNSLYASIYGQVMEITKKKDANIKDMSSSNLSYTMVEFYTLIAMACLYSGILSMFAINQSLANMTATGKRMAVSPTSKGKIILSSVLASYLTSLIGIFLLFIYTIFVLHVDYGNRLFYIILLAFAGSFAGLSLGVATSCCFKVSDNTKTGIIISITMLGCFLSGMMGITMKYIVDKNIPIVNKLNPANMITDGFYSLYYYDTMDRFFLNFFSLLLFATVLIVISIFHLRRQKYDSI